MNLDNIYINTQNSIKISGSKIIYFDPFKIESETHDADIIFVTHDHMDHYDPESIRKIVKDNTVFVFPESLEDKIDSEFKDRSVLVKVKDNLTIDNLSVSTVPAYNIGRPFHKPEYNYVGYVVTMDDVTYYVAGDTDALEENMNLKCDVALIPVGGKFTMDYKEAAEFINHLKPIAAIPTHYGMVGTDEDGNLFKALVDSDIEVAIKL